MQQPFLIESDKAYEEAMMIIYNLMNKEEANLTPDELDDLGIMAIAAEQYEDNQQKTRPQRERLFQSKY